jgi:hypothetical protein
LDYVRCHRNARNALTCGRFTKSYTWSYLQRLYNLMPGAPPTNLEPRFNVCPTDPADAVAKRIAGERQPRRRLQGH